MLESNSSPAGQQQAFITETKRGALLHTMHVERTVKIYPVVESELKTLSILNSLALVFSSVGTGLLTFAVGVVTDAAVQGQLTDYGRALVCVVAPVFGTLALISYGIAVAAWRSRGSELSRIREESTGG